MQTNTRGFNHGDQNVSDIWNSPVAQQNPEEIEEEKSLLEIMNKQEEKEYSGYLKKKIKDHS